MIKKFMIIIILTLFMISAVAASDIDEDVTNDDAEIKIQEFVEVNQPNLEEIQIDDIVENDVIVDDSPVKYTQEYNDSNIINEAENYNEIENYQYNDTYIETLINRTLDNDSDLDTDLDSNNLIYHHIFINFIESNIFSYRNIDFNVKIIDSGFNLSKFKDINKFKILTHEDIIFYNNYCSFLTHHVGKNMVFSCDKLLTDFAFSINNSIVGSADAIIYHILNSNFLNLNLFKISYFQTFSNFAHIFININYNE